jgi:aconitase A
MIPYIQLLLLRKCIRINMKNITEENELWNSLPAAERKIYQWQDSSTYIKLPPFFDNMGLEPEEVKRHFRSKCTCCPWETR